MGTWKVTESPHLCFIRPSEGGDGTVFYTMDRSVYESPVVKQELMFFETTLLSGSPDNGENEDAGDNPNPVF